MKKRGACLGSQYEGAVHLSREGRGGCWSSAYFQKKLLKSLHGARILSQGDSGNRGGRMETGGERGAKLWVILLRLVWLFFLHGPQPRWAGPTECQYRDVHIDQ